MKDDSILENEFQHQQLTIDADVIKEKILKVESIKQHANLLNMELEDLIEKKTLEDPIF